MAYQKMRKSTTVAFIIFVLTLIVMTLIAFSYIRYFKNDRYENIGIVDTIAKNNGAITGSLSKGYSGINNAIVVFNAKSIKFFSKYKYIDANNIEQEVKNAVVIKNNISYKALKEFNSNGGHFFLLDKKGKVINSQVNIAIEKISEKDITIILTTNSDIEPCYLLVEGIKVASSNVQKRVFIIEKQ